MSFLLKFLSYFILSFAILCIPIEKQRTFDLIYDFAVPKAKKIIKSFKKDALENIRIGKKLGKKYLLNVEPAQIEDSVSNSHAAPQTYLNSEMEPMEEYTAEEKEILKKILEEPRKD
ncbi:MAG: hypothetical protein OEY33_00200 [Bdellovibrionales bacterium]|nr:hypothetical protein [Bdellovibrionales bacterium]